MSEPWLLDELAYAGPEHLDEAYVQGYEYKAGFDPTADIEHLRQFGLSKASNIIDFGAGTGVFARAIAPLCNSVVAVDPSTAMLTRLQSAIAEGNVTNLLAVKAGFLSYLPVADAVNIIFTRNALHHLPDFFKVLALSKMHAMLTPGGILRIRDLIYDFRPQETAERLSAWLSGAVDDPALGWTATELAEHVREEYSTFSWIFEAMLQQTGFEIIDREYQRDIYGAYTCRAVPTEHGM